MKKFDTIIIGFGKGGKTLAGTLAKEGKKVALVEKSDKMYGGTCINVGCIPSKSLVHSAALSAEMGGTFEEKAKRYQDAVQKKNKLTAMLRKKNFDKLNALPNVTIATGTASFLDAHHVQIDKNEEIEEWEGDQIFINTGAAPFIPPIPGLKESKNQYLSETLLNLEKLPKRLVIIGGGYIGIEFASIYTNFGSEVTVIQDGSVFLPREDEEIAAAVLERLQEKGVKIFLSTKIEAVQEKEDHSVVLIQTEKEKKSISADAILVAAGRRPNIEELNLEAAGVATTSRGAIQTDEYLKTTAENIWAMGDVAGGLQFTYVSLDDFRIVKSQVLGENNRSMANRGAVPYSVFLDPPFSRVGMSEKEAKEKGYEVKIAKLAAAAIPKAQVLNQTAGLLKAVIDAKTNKILGVHLFCAESHEIINLIKFAIDAKISYVILRDGIYTHPTMCEAFNDLFAAAE